MGVGAGLLTAVLTQYPMTYVAFLLLVPLAWSVLMRTTLGLSIRAVGENPETADAAGISVACTRYFALIIGAALMGVGGAFFTLAALNIIAGRDWVCIALRRCRRATCAQGRAAVLGTDGLASGMAAISRPTAREAKNIGRTVEGVPSYFLFALAGGRSRASLRSELRLAPIAAGIASFAAYVLVLAALQRASAASVAAVRETSVMIAAALAAPLLGEAVGPARVVGAVLVVVGIALIGF